MEMESSKENTLVETGDDGLQKFTNDSCKKNQEQAPARSRQELQKKKTILEEYKTSPEDDDWIMSILYGEKWTPEKFHHLSEKEKALFKKRGEKAMNILALEDLDRFIERMSDLWNLPENKRRIWEWNHIAIIAAIDRMTKEKNRFPSRMEISDYTGMSRVTINKHLKEYFDSDQYIEKKEEYILMRENVLSRVYKYACNGDMKAARIFLDATMILTTTLKIAIRNQQNNFIQVNGLMITEDQIKGLSQERISQIQRIITGSEKQL